MAKKVKKKKRLRKGKEKKKKLITSLSLQPTKYNKTNR